MQTEVQRVKSLAQGSPARKQFAPRYIGCTVDAPLASLTACLAGEQEQGVVGEPASVLVLPLTQTSSQCSSRLRVITRKAMPVLLASRAVKAAGERDLESPAHDDGGPKARTLEGECVSEPDSLMGGRGRGSCGSDTRRAESSVRYLREDLSLSPLLSLFLLHNLSLFLSLFPSLPPPLHCPTLPIPECPAPAQLLQAAFPAQSRGRSLPIGLLSHPGSVNMGRLSGGGLSVLATF